MTTLIARLIVTYGMAGIGKIAIGHKWSLTLKELSILWFGGGIRGAVAFALIVSVTGFDDRNVMIASVLFVVVITTIGLGALSPFWIWLMTPKRRANCNRDSGTMFVDLAKLR